MFDGNQLRAEIARAGKTQKEVAAYIGISANTFSQKINNGTFGLDEAEKMIKLLDIQQPGVVFFNEQK